MTDRISAEARSWNMSRIGATNTGPERAVRRMLFALGYRFRLHRRDLPGTPDIVFVGMRKVVFVHGCFWHGHARCRRATQPASNATFWERKIAKNKLRDKNAIAALKQAGWRTFVVWQCQLRQPEVLTARLQKFLSS